MQIDLSPITGRKIKGTTVVCVREGCLDSLGNDTEYILIIFEVMWWIKRVEVGIFKNKVRFGHWGRSFEFSPVEL